MYHERSIEVTEEQKDKNFVKFFRPFMDEVTKMAGENYTAFKLFQLLCKHMDGYNALCASQQVLMELLDVSRPTIGRAIKYLKENGWICVLKSGTSNVYIVNPNVAWTSYGNQKEYCKFQANVLLSATENNEFLNNSKATTHFKTIDTEFMKSLRTSQERFEKECEVLQNKKETQISERSFNQVELCDVV